MFGIIFEIAVLDIILVLSVINLMLIITIIFVAVKRDIQEKKKQQIQDEIYNTVIQYLEDKIDKSKIVEYQKKKPYNQVVFQIMLDFGKEENISHKFDELGYTDKILRLFERSSKLEYVKYLGIMKTERGIPLLMKSRLSGDFEVQYSCSYVISKFSLNEIQLEEYLEHLFASNILRDRIIEMIENLNLPIEYIFMKLKTSSEYEKVIFIRSLEGKDELKKETNSDQLLGYLTQSIEIKIAAIIALASTKNNRYMPILMKCYQKEEQWEVRSSIAKMMLNFNGKEVIQALEIMVFDDNWWVRYNSAAVLSRKGKEGISVLMNLTTGDNKSVSDMAYYQLNANKHVYDVVNKDEMRMENADASG